VGSLHLAVLWSFAFAQPLLDLLGDTPEFFVARGNTRGDVLLLALGLVLLPPLALTLLEALAGLISARLRKALHISLIGLLSSAFALQLLGDEWLPAAGLLAVAGVLGAIAALAYARSSTARTALTVLAPAPVLFLALFLFVSPASKLVLPGDEARAAGVVVPGEPPVVMIVFDELAAFALHGPDGRIDASRYPNFARLARDAIWYPNAPRYREGGVDRFLAIVPPSALRPGANDMELIALIGGKPVRVRRPEAEELRLVRRGTRVAIVSPLGAEIAVDPAATGGFLDAIAVERGQVEISGWAGDAERGRVAERVLAFVRGRLVAAARPGIERADVAQATGPQLLRSGFELRARLAQRVPTSQVQVFAVFGRRAMPVPLAG
jgi:hypothetical protein